MEGLMSDSASPAVVGRPATATGPGPATGTDGSEHELVDAVDHMTDPEFLAGQVDGFARTQVDRLSAPVREIASL
jgi:hypothetical protein